MAAYVWLNTEYVCFIVIYQYQMNVRARKEEGKIRTIDFGEHLSGFHLSLVSTNRNHQNATIQPSQFQIRPHTALSHFPPEPVPSQSGRARPEHTQLRWKLAFGEQQQEFEKRQQQYGEESASELRVQEQRHLQFVKSYHSWLKETQVQEYQSSRLMNSLGLKKTRVSMRPRKQVGVFEFKAYQHHFNKDYQPANLFPARQNQTVKKIYQKKGEEKRGVFGGKYKSEGELKLRVVRSVARAGDKGERGEKGRKQGGGWRQAQGDSGGLLRTFSNPKILAIQNRQLVTGTKIILSN